jgi:hypothetical protein
MVAAVEANAATLLRDLEALGRRCAAGERDSMEALTRSADRRAVRCRRFWFGITIIRLALRALPVG